MVAVSLKKNFFQAEDGIRDVERSRGLGDVYKRQPFPIALSYVAAASEIIGSWLLITGFMTRVGALAIAGTISVAIYHAIITSGFNIYLLELLGLYFGGAVCILTLGSGMFAIDYLLFKRFNQ
nr:hypothetical protein 62 [Paracoccaceae bacterium]